MSHVAEGMKVDQKPSWSVFVEKRRFVGVNLLVMIVACIVCLPATVYSRPRDVVSPDDSRNFVSPDKRFSIRTDQDGAFILRLPDKTKVMRLDDFSGTDVSVRWRSDGRFFRIEFHEGSLGDSAIFRRNEKGAVEAFSRVDFHKLNLEKYLTDERDDIAWGINSVDIHKEFITVILSALSPPGAPHPFASDYDSYEFYLKPKGQEFEVIRIERFPDGYYEKRVVVWWAK